MTKNITIEIRDIPSPGGIADRGGRVFFEIYFKLNNSFFPEQGWTDLAPSILSMWIDTLLKIDSEDEDEKLLHFMDGPFTVKIEKKDNNLKLIFYKIFSMNQKKNYFL